jgi:hypothetical protein
MREFGGCQSDGVGGQDAQHFVNFFPLPHGQGSFRPTFGLAVGADGKVPHSVATTFDSSPWWMWSLREGSVGADTGVVGVSARFLCFPNSRYRICDSVLPQSACFWWRACWKAALCERPPKSLIAICQNL